MERMRYVADEPKRNNPNHAAFSGEMNLAPTSIPRHPYS